MPEKVEPQLDFLNKLEKPDEPVKVIAAAEEMPAPVKKVFRKARPHEIKKPGRRANLGWAGEYYGNDPDDPRQ